MDSRRKGVVLKEPHPMFTAVVIFRGGCRRRAGTGHTRYRAYPQQHVSTTDAIARIVLFHRYIFFV
jgi:hypothetical protein